MSETRLISRDVLGCFAGQSSMCWIPTPSTQVFDSENAIKQLDELWNSLPKLSDVITSRTIADAGVFGDMYKHGWNDCSNDMIELVEEKLSSQKQAQAENNDWIAYKAGDKVKDGIYLVTIEYEDGNYVDSKQYHSKYGWNGGNHTGEDDIIAYKPLPSAFTPYNKNGV